MFCCLAGTYVVHACVWRCRRGRFVQSRGRAGLVVHPLEPADSLTPATVATSVERGDTTRTTVAIGAAEADGTIAAGPGVLS